MKGANSKLVSSLYRGLNAVRKRFYASDVDKFHREVQFYVACEGLPFVPRLYAADPERLEITLELIDGSPPGGLDEATIADFYAIIEVLQGRQQAGHKPAVEAVRSAAELAKLLRGRVSQQRTYSSFLTHGGDIRRTEENVLRAAARRAEDVIEGGHRFGAWFSIAMLSPSDLGIHNCLRTGSGLKIFDFEFAGVDSVVNLLFNFHLHPRHCDGDIDFRVRERILAGLEHLCVDKPGRAESDLLTSAYAALIAIRLLHALSDEALNVRKERGLFLDSDLGAHFQATLGRLKRYAQYANESAAD
jgi:hypothetical protein